MDFNKANIILLPTKDTKSILHITKDTKSLLVGERIVEIEPYKNLISQHLYVFDYVSEINIGDYCIILSVNKLHPDKYNKTIGKVTFKTLSGIYIDGENYQYDNIEPYKIIASTDTSLDLPKPSDSFIDKFVEEYNDGNVIEEVLVQYEQVNKFGKLVTYEDLDYPEITGDYDFKMIPKVNSEDNTITIKMFKNNWSKDEVIKALNSYRKFSNTVSNSSESSLRLWIDKNLH